MRHTASDCVAIQEKAREKLKNQGPGAVAFYGTRLGLGKSFCNQCQAVTHTLPLADKSWCLLCEYDKPVDAPIPNRVRQKREYRRSIVVEKIGDWELEITTGAHEVKDCDGSDSGFNLVCLHNTFERGDRPKEWIAFGTLEHALKWANGRTNGEPRIKSVSDLELINLQRMAEEAFTFEELIKKWKDGREN